MSWTVFWLTSMRSARSCPRAIPSAILLARTDAASRSACSDVTATYSRMRAYHATGTRFGCCRFSTSMYRLTPVLFYSFRCIALWDTENFPYLRTSWRWRAVRSASVLFMPQTTTDAPPRLDATKTCSVADCGKPAYRKGLCDAHRLRLRRHGDPLGGGPTPNLASTLAERLWPRVDKSADCWEWTGAKTTRGGYGHLRFRGVTHRVHRVAWELTNGPIPDGLVIDHICRNPLCVRPDHLQVVTPRENNENQSSSSRSSSGLRGVSWASRDQKWVVTVRHNGRSYSGGRFTDLGEAERAVIALRNTLHTNNLADRKVRAA